MWAIFFYTNQNIRVQWGSSISIICTVSNGVKQGGVLSPILFTIYIDELLNELRKSGLGCHIGQQFCGMCR
jgi:retron-type reverse transcriptase